MKKNYFYNLAQTLANILIPIISFPYAAKILGPEGIGKAQFALSFATYFSIFAALGIPVFAVTEIAKYRNDKQETARVFSSLFIISAICSLLVFAIYLPVIWFNSSLHAERDLYLTAGLLILFSFTTIDWFYAGIEAFKTMAIRSAVIKTASLLLLFFWVKSRTDYTAYLATIVFAILGNNLLSLVFLRKYTFLTFSGLQFKKYIKPVVFILGTSLASSMYTVLDTVLLGFLSDDKSVGFYTAANKLTKITIPVITSMGVILIPKISYLYNSDDGQQLKTLIEKSFAFIVAVSIPALFGFILLAPNLLELFAGKEFLQATLSMQILAFLPLLVGLGHLYGIQMLVPFGRNKEMFYSAISGLLLCVFLNFLLVPHLNQVGAALANVLCEVAVTGLYFYFIPKNVTKYFAWKPILTAFGSSIVFLPIIKGLELLKLGNTAFVFISGLLCGFVYLISQLFLFKNKMLIEVLDEIKVKLNSLC